MLVTTCLIASALAAPGAAWAQAAPEADRRLDALLERLHAKGILTGDDLALLQRRRGETPSAGSRPGAAALPTNATFASGQPAMPPPADDTRLVTQADLRALKDRVALRAGDGVGLDLGDVRLTLNAQINAFYVHDSGGTGPTIVGGLANLGGRSSAIRDGLVPGYLMLGAATEQAGFDIGAHVGLYPGITSVTQQNGANSPGIPVALASAGLDVRKLYLTIGRPNWGEIKLGRDVGLFAADAVFNDITFLGVGSPGANGAPSNTTLGRAGYGIIYPDFMPQITYTSPKIGGLQASAGIFAPMQTTGRTETNGAPQVQAHISYTLDGRGFTSTLWASALVQKHDASGGLPHYTGRGFDLGAKFGYGPMTLTGYYYGARGVGTTGLFILPTDAAGRTRKSRGYYVQGTYRLGRVVFGGSYGGSWLDPANGEINPDLVRSNTSWIGQVRYPLTPWINLLSEYIASRSTADNGGRVSNATFATGAVLAF